MDSWERFDETSLLIYSSLNMENITDVDYRHGKKVLKECKTKNLGDYHDLYVQTETLLLADAFDDALRYMSLIPLIFHLHQD